MVTTAYYESGYRFTDPIRKFKANDPYFYKVDNLPIAELEENTKFLKDQVDGLINKTSVTLSVDRSTFSELQPYVNGLDFTVRVKPGRYTGRVNDAYSIDPLQFITQVEGFELDSNVWQSQTNRGLNLSSVLEQFKSVIGTDALNMNGLAERVFTWPMETPDLISTHIDATVAGLNPDSFPSRGPAQPGYNGVSWMSDTSLSALRVGVINPSIADSSFYRSSQAESDFIKRWRGVARTSIVNVENEIEIEIPEFDSEDFYYYDENGNKVYLEATQRIDLVFIYTKAIDQKETTLPIFDGNTPTSITSPTLGIVKGAGVGFSLKKGTNLQNQSVVVSTQLQNGTQIIQAHPADENSENTGVGTIKGSFPSPDDLMNLSPLLCETLESDSLALIGQSILPVAYIVVRDGQASILETDLIDIRPFFRTTELSYNERAGIAAATPQISLANPVASEGYVDYVAKVLNDRIEAVNSNIPTIQTSNGGSPATLSPKVVGTGYVKGGFYYGVESVLSRYVQRAYNITDIAQAKQQVISRFGYPAGTTIANLPDWDIANWCKTANIQNKGLYPNDRVNFYNYGPWPFTGDGYPTNIDTYGALKAYSNIQTLSDQGISRILKMGTDAIANGYAWEGITSFYYVKKRIQLDRSQIPWASDYHVDVQFLNCIPLSTRAGGNNAHQAASHAGVWVDKKDNEFTIFVSWVARDQLDSSVFGLNASPEPGPNYTPQSLRTDGEHFAGFSVINESLMSVTQNGMPSTGIAIYPTISFQVYGIPQGFSEEGINLNTANPLLILR